VSSGDEHTRRASELIERLLVDPGFRASFRNDPASACREFELDDLADELGGGGKAMHTLELRESKSSLAGVVMALAGEGIGVVELRGLIDHGMIKGPAHAAGMRALHGVNPAHPAASLRSEVNAQNPLRGASSNPLGAAQRVQQAAGGGAAPSAPPSGPAGAQEAPASAGGPSAPGPGGGGAGMSAGAGGAGAESAPGAPAPGGGGAAPPGGSQYSGSGGQPNQIEGAGGGHAGSPSAGGANTPPAPGPGWPEQVPPAGSAPAAPPPGGASPSAWPDEAQAPGGAPAAAFGAAAEAPGAAYAPQTGERLATLLQSPRLEMAPGARAVLAQGNADPRLVAVLANALSHHTIVIGDMQTSTEPVHAQAIDIVSVDGQPVGPTNIGARDLVTEIAALEPGERPSEIGTPWPIQARGFFPGSENRLHLAFTSEGDYHPAQFAGPQGRSAAEAMAGPGRQGVAGGAQGSGGQPGAVAAEAGAASSQQAPRTGAAAAIAYARSMLHKLPETTGDNSGPALDKFEASFGFHDAPWCGIFIGHVLETVGLKVPDKVASVAAILEMAQSGEGPFHKGVLPVTSIRAGDLATFGGSEHVALVTSVDAQGIHTISGNYANNVNEATSSPGEVTGVVRPNYEAAAPSAPVAPALPAASASASSSSPLQPAPPKPETAVFRARPSKSAASLHHTVKFLQAVQPESQASPSAAQAASGPGDPRGAAGVGGAASALEANAGPIGYPGDSAAKPQIAKWMGEIAQQNGLPRELPVMAALVESSLHNDPGGDRDSVGYFQMRAGIWNNGQYAGYPQNPALQLKWFIDQALAVKRENPSLATDPSKYGEWVADIERPAEEFRGRYQLRLAEARQLLAEG
jgi:hypothetical protein